MAMATPRLAPHHGDAGAAKTASVARAAPIASISSDPAAPDSFTNLHAAACAVLCGGQRAQHLMPSPSAHPRTTSLHLAILHSPAALGGLRARVSALLAYATAHAGLCGTHNITHCCLYRSVGARLPPPAFCPRAHACTLPRLRRRRRASRSPQSHDRAVRRSLRHTWRQAPVAPSCCGAL
jgi:hypothetical protein